MFKVNDMISEKTSKRPINRDMLKFIAVIPMFIGHFFSFTIKELDFFGLPIICKKLIIRFQYLAPPIFFFFIAEGFYHTHDEKKYAARLGILAVITQFFYTFYYDMKFDINSFFTDWNVIAMLFLSLLMLIVWESDKNDTEKMLLVVGLMYLGKHTEWGIMGMLIVLVMHIFRDRPNQRFAAYELIIIADTLIRNRNNLSGIFASSTVIHFLVLTASMIIITFFYNGKKGRHPKFSQVFFYVFYPAHLLLIILVKLCMR